MVGGCIMRSFARVAFLGCHSLKSGAHRDSCSWDRRVVTTGRFRIHINTRHGITEISLANSY